MVRLITTMAEAKPHPARSNRAWEYEQLKSQQQRQEHQTSLDVSPLRTSEPPATTVAVAACRTPQPAANHAPSRQSSMAAAASTAALVSNDETATLLRSPLWTNRWRWRRCRKRSMVGKGGGGGGGGQWNTLSAAAQLTTVLLLCCSFVDAYIDKDLVVETNKGKIRGVTLKSATNK